MAQLRIKRLRWGIAAVLGVLFAISSLSGAQAAAAPPPAKPDYGHIDGSVYSNEFFGLHISIPAGWSVAGEAAKKQLIEKGKELIKSPDAASQHGIDESVNRTTQLLTISRFEINKPNAQTNPSLVCLVERLPDAAAGIKSRDYAALVGDGLKGSSLTLAPVGEIHAETVDGVEFSVLDVKGKVQEQDVYQKYYVNIVKGYSLVFITTYYSDDDHKLTAAIVASVKMRHP